MNETVKVRGKELKEGMQFRENDKDYDVLMGPNYYHHTSLQVIVFDHHTQTEKYKSIKPNKKYEIF